METLDQPTTDQRTASDGNRIVAYLIDAVVTGALSFVPFVGWIAGIAYFLTRDGLPFLNGQSLGKKAMNLRAVTSDGQDLTNNWGPVIIRNVVLIIPFFPIVELIVMLTNPQNCVLATSGPKPR